MKKVPAVILGIVAPIILLSAMVARRANNKGSDNEHKALTSTSLLLTLLWFLRSDESRASWANRLAAGAMTLGAGAVWVPGVMQGLTNAGKNTARLFQDADADVQESARPIPEDADDRKVLTGTGSLEALSQVIKAAKKLPDGQKIVDIYLKNTGETASPDGDVVYEFEVQGPVGWYDDGAPRRVAIAKGIVRYNQDGSLEAGPFDWSDRLAEALGDDGGYARITPIENAPQELVDGLVVMLADRNFPLQVQADSAQRAAARTSSELQTATTEAQGRAKRKLAGEELASINPYLTKALNTTLGQDLKWWSGQQGHLWVQPLLINFANQGEKEAQAVVSGMSPFISHQNGRHVIPMLDEQDIGNPEVVDVTDLVSTLFSDDELFNICPECATAQADDDEDKKLGESVRGGSANKSLNNRRTAVMGFEPFTIIMQGYDGHADNWGLRFTIVDGNRRVVAEGKRLDSHYLPQIDWPVLPTGGVSLTCIAAPNAGSLASGDMLINQVSKWLRKRGVTVNGSALAQNM